MSSRPTTANLEKREHSRYQFKKTHDWTSTINSRSLLANQIKDLSPWGCRLRMVKHAVPKAGRNISLVLFRKGSLQFTAKGKIRWIDSIYSANSKDHVYVGIEFDNPESNILPLWKKHALHRVLAVKFRPGRKNRKRTKSPKTLYPGVDSVLNLLAIMFIGAFIGIVITIYS